MESGKITDNQITASSFLDPNHGAEKVRLNSQQGGGAWCSAVNDQNQFLQVDLGTSHMVTGVSEWIEVFCLFVCLFIVVVFGRGVGQKEVALV